MRTEITDEDYTKRLVSPYGFAFCAGTPLFFTDIKPAWPPNYII